MATRAVVRQVLPDKGKLVVTVERWMDGKWANPHVQTLFDQEVSIPVEAGRVRVIVEEESDLMEKPAEEAKPVMRPAPPPEPPPPPPTPPVGVQGRVAPRPSEKKDEEKPTPHRPAAPVRHTTPVHRRK